MYKLIQLILFYILLFCLFIFQLKADSTTNPVNPLQLKATSPTRYQPFLIAGGLIGYGVARQGILGLQHLDRDTKAYANRISPKGTRIDDFMQYTPILAVYALDFTGLQAKHTIVERTQFLSTAALFTLLSVHTLKSSVGVIRPDGSNSKSFPSGHTATAFLGAHMLFKEYKDENIWIASSGYLIAAGTGALRIINNKHWFSDVVAGAGFGILSTELSYLLTPKIKNLLNPSKGRRHINITPELSHHSSMLKATIHL